MKRTPRVLVSIFLIICSYSALAQSAWPKEIPFKNGGKATIYQPQPESLEGNKIVCRSAISINETPTSQTIFGAIFYVAYLTTDKDSRTAVIDSISISNIKFSVEADQSKVDKLVALIEKEVPKWNMEIALDALVATIRKDYPNAEVYNNDPPKIFYTTKPTSLVILDGEPIIKNDKDLDADRVLNTPALIFKEGSQWNMYNGGIWYKSTSVTDGWTAEKTMSKKVQSINDQIKKQEKENNDGKASTDKPEVTDILVSTVPAEVIQSKGEPVYKAIEGTSLQYVSNTSNNIFKDTKSQSIYILIAGRWYKSSSLNGPWTFNEPDKMPEDFTKIPEGSEKDNVLASIAGTDAAEEAMIDAEIPQTAKVDRKKATVKVEYDGTAKFENIEGTSLQRAENSNLTILKDASGKYFALDNGVWFTASSATGPWSVATERPKEVENIPMKSAAYNSKFVHIYEVTPEYTIQGYTAGYLGSYIQGDPVLVFGTGFYYHPWYGSIFYPAPCTWGFGFSYNPWTGWSMGVGFNVGFMHVGFAFGGGYGYGGGWYGPPMYRPPYYRPPYGGGGYYGHGGGNHYGNNNININTGGNNININSNNRNNLYNNKDGISTKSNNRSNSTGKIDNKSRDNINNNKGNLGNNKGNAGNNLGNNNNANKRPDAKPAKGDNNVFADKDGNVFQKDSKGNINERDNKSNSWKSTGNKEISNNQGQNSPTTNNQGQNRPTTNNQGQNRPNTGNQPQNRAPSNNVNRDMQARDRGTQRTSNYNQYQSRPAQQRPSGGGGARPSGGGGGARKR
jgi:hypothetical protein